MYGCESWTIKKTECQRIDAFWTVVLEKTLKSPLNCKEMKSVNPKGNQRWKFIARTDAKTETPIFWPPDVKSLLIKKKPWWWERLKAGGEADDRGQDGWMASSIQWTWVWAYSRRYWRTGKPGMLQSMESKTAGHDWVTEQLQQEQNGHLPLNLNYLHTHIQSRVKTLLQASPISLTLWITGKWFQARKQEGIKK